MPHEGLEPDFLLYFDFLLSEHNDRYTYKMDGSVIISTAAKNAKGSDLHPDFLPIFGRAGGGGYVKRFSVANFSDERLEAWWKKGGH